MTCFLEYEDSETVRVTDLVHSLGDSGWTLSKSSYRKLRLSKEWLCSALSTAGFKFLSHRAAGGLSLVIASQDRLS